MRQHYTEQRKHQPLLLALDSPGLDAAESWVCKVGRCGHVPQHINASLTADKFTPAVF